MVINTLGGPFTIATDAANESLLAALSSSSSNKTAVLDAVQRGCATCEAAQCDRSVGFGGSPDEACETTLDALLMDGAPLNTGAVAALRRVRDAAGVARAVLDRTDHSLLAGDLATAFAVQNGFVEDSIGTAESVRACREWRDRDQCQPNYRRRRRRGARRRASCNATPRTERTRHQRIKRRDTKQATTPSP